MIAIFIQDTQKWYSVGIYIYIYIFDQNIYIYSDRIIAKLKFYSCLEMKLFVSAIVKVSIDLISSRRIPMQKKGIKN